MGSRTPNVHAHLIPVHIQHVVIRTVRAQVAQIYSSGFDLLHDTMNRRELQALTRDRFADSRALLRAHRYCAAYHMTGYAVKCALKACSAKTINDTTYPTRNSSTQLYARPGEDPLIYSMGPGIEVGDAGKHQFTRGKLNGRYFDSAYIYRLSA